MINKVSIYYFCAFFVLFASCNRKTTKNVESTTSTPTQPTKPEPPSTPKNVDNSKAYIAMSIERTICFGNCPVFEIKLMSNGKAYFNGKRGVDLIGEYEADVNPERLKEMWHNVEQVKFFEFASAYPIDEKNKIADLPSCITFVNDGKQNKRINDNYDSPANLQWFEHELETFFMHLDWKKLNK